MKINKRDRLRKRAKDEDDSEQFNGREGETATFLSMAFGELGVACGGFAPRHLSRSTSSFGSAVLSLRNYMLKILMLFVIAFCSVTTDFGQATSKNKEQIQVVGTVIGRWHDGGGTVYPGARTIPEFILIRVDEVKGLLKLGQHIQVRYSYSKRDEELLPKEFYSQKAQWQFTLERIEGYDSPMQDIIYSKSGREENGEPVKILEIIAGAEDEHLPLDEVVELYEAKLGSIKRN